MALDNPVADLQYPVAAPVDGLIQPNTAEMIGLNKVVLRLIEISRTENGLKFNWQTSNPGEYPAYVHIGNPPVIGSDGILYGIYQSPDIADVPLSQAGKTAEWMTEVVAPKNIKGYYILLSVETGKQRLFTHYAVHISGQ